MYTLKIIYVIVTSIVCLINGINFTLPKFPDDFKFGVSTAAYQIEGAWNEEGKSENIWDKIIHENQSIVEGQTNADVTCDSYHLYQRDVEMLAELGVDFYRFSISWSRILPRGRDTYVNKDGINYYNKLIDSLLARGITPMVTLYHWDLPQILEYEGGFLNYNFPKIFEDYARVVFQAFGDRVKHWVTFNEPVEICIQGYGMDLRAPRLNYHGYGEYICAANLLGAHARAYHLYNDTYRMTQNGKVGLSFSAQWGEPYSNSDEDRQATDDSIQFFFGLFAHPILSKNGGYPSVVVARVDKNRLVYPPAFPDLRNTIDFLGLNHYDLYLVNKTVDKSSRQSPSFDEDLDVQELAVRRWSKLWVDLGPPGFGKLLHWIKNNYNNPTIIVTENGVPTNPGLDDRSRAWYIRRYLAEILKAISEGVNVKGYMVWSLMDNFEWLNGYTQKFGLYEVDFKDPNKIRVARRSAAVYKEIIKTKTIDPDYLNKKDWKKGIDLENQSKRRFQSKFDTRNSIKKILENDSNSNDSAVEILIKALNSQLLTHNRPFD